MQSVIRHTVGPLRSYVTAVLPIGLVFGVLLVVVPAATFSFPVALLCLFAVATATVAIVIGLDRTGSGFLLLGFATVALTDVRPLGASSFLELSDAFFVVGFMLSALRLFGTPLRIPLSFLVGGFGFLAIAAISAAVGEQPQINFHYVLDLAIGMVLVPVLVVWWQPGRKRVVAAAVAYVLGTVVNVVAAVFQGELGGGRASGLTTHPNIMGLCALLSLALMPFLLKALPRNYVWAVGVGSVVSLYCIWISGSRAALACAVAVTLLYPLLKRSILAALGVVALSLPAIIVVGREAKNPDSANALGRLLGGGAADTSTRAREAGAEAGFDQFLHHPLLGDGWDYVWGIHNVYLQIAAAIGIFGFAFYLIMLAPMLKPLIKVPSPHGLLALPVLAVAMISVVDPAVGARHIWVLISLALCASRLAGLEDESPQGRRAETVPTLITKRRPADRE